MTNLKIYQTNSGLGYGQIAFLLQTFDRGKTTYLCIGTNFDNDSIYQIGEYVEMGDYELNPTSFTLEDSPLFNNLTKLFFDPTKYTIS